MNLTKSLSLMDTRVLRIPSSGWCTATCLDRRPFCMATIPSDVPVELCHHGETLSTSAQKIGATVPGIIEDIGPQTSHKVLTRCVGCGAMLQSTDPFGVGFVPTSVTEKYSDGRIKSVSRKQLGLQASIPAGIQQEVVIDEKASRTRVLICRRCFQLQNYKTSENALLVSLPVDTPLRRPTRSLGLGDTSKIRHTAELIERIVYAIRPGSLVLHVVDMTDLESTVVPELHEACRKKHLDTLWIVNKIDCLPRGSRNADELLRWIRRYSRQMKHAVMDDITFISAQSGFNFPKMEKMMHRHIDENSGNSKYIYIVGRTNVGKSTLVNQLLRHIGYRHLGPILRGSPFGVTQSALPGTTLDFVPFTLPRGYKIIDSPGIPLNHHMSSVLTSNQDIQSLVHQSTMTPMVFRLKPEMSLLLGGIARVDFIDGGSIIVGCFVSKHVACQLCPTPIATQIILQKIGKELRPPSAEVGDVPPLRRHRLRLFAEDQPDDISIAGLGWLSMKGNSEEKVFDVWVPEGVHVFRRPGLPVELSENKIIRSTASNVARKKRDRHQAKEWKNEIVVGA